MRSFDELEAKAEWVRKETIRYAMRTQGGHLASSLSTVEILTALYYAVMEEHDVCIVSKGHGGYAQRVILQGLGPGDEVHSTPGREDPGCLEYEPNRGILTSTGALGHGLSVALGLALSKGRQGAPGHVWCIVGDGECEEGSIYEASELFRQLIAEGDEIPLTVIIDWNGLRAMGRSSMGLDPGAVPACDMPRLVKALRTKPALLQVATVKGKGVPFMEGKAEWHFRLPSSPDELSWIDSYLNS